MVVEISCSGTRAVSTIAVESSADVLVAPFAEAARIGGMIRFFLISLELSSVFLCLQLIMDCGEFVETSLGSRLSVPRTLLAV